MAASSFCHDRKFALKNTKTYLEITRFSCLVFILTSCANPLNSHANLLKTCDQHIYKQQSDYAKDKRPFWWKVQKRM